MKEVQVRVLRKFREYKGRLHRLIWLRAQAAGFLFAVISIAVAFWWFPLEPGAAIKYAINLDNVASTAGAVIGFGSLIILALSSIKSQVLADTKFVIQKLRPLMEKDLRVSNPRGAGHTQEISEYIYRDQAIIYDPNVNLLLEEGNNPIDWESAFFELHPYVMQHLPVFIRNMKEAPIGTSDDPKVRLKSDITVETIKHGDEVELQRTSYFRDRLSNTLANYQVMCEGRRVFSLRDEVLEPSGELICLSESKLSNQLGGSTILITRRGGLISLRQGNFTAENPAVLVPAGSGSFDPLEPEAFAGLSFQDYARQEAIRELQEECGIKSENITSIQICGFGRYLYRCGKPEVFCIATTDLTNEQINVPVREWDYQQKTPELFLLNRRIGRIELMEGLDRFIRELEDPNSRYQQACGPLYWNVVFARNYIASAPTKKLKQLFPDLTS